MATKKKTASSGSTIKVTARGFGTGVIEVRWDECEDHFVLHESSGDSTWILSEMELAHLYEVLKANFGDRTIDA